MPFRTAIIGRFSHDFPIVLLRLPNTVPRLLPATCFILPLRLASYALRRGQLLVTRHALRVTIAFAGRFQYDFPLIARGRPGGRSRRNPLPKEDPRA